MHPAIPPAIAVFATSLAMGLYVLTRREKTGIHWLLLAIFAALGIWTLGTISRFSVTSIEGLEVSLRLIFFGVFVTPPLWLLLATRHAHGESVMSRPGSMVALMVPSVLGYVALVTNEAHHLVIREVSFETLEAGTSAWAGPVFWAVLVWSYLCVAAGSGLYLRSASQMSQGEERHRRFILAAVAVIPVVSSFVYVFRLLPVPFDLTPTGLAFSLVLLYAVVFRYQLLESLPLARREVIEHHRDGIVMANTSGIILDSNPAAGKILGSNPSSLRGRPMGEAIGALEENGGARVRGGFGCPSDAIDPVVVEIRTADHRSIEVSSACVRNDAGEPAGYFAVLRDRTEERRLDRIVRQTQKLESVGALAAGIAHEVNNPLAFIRSNLTQIQRLGELVDASERGPDAKLADELCDLRPIADETMDGIERISSIVADIRHLSSPKDEVFRPFDTNDVVRDAIRLANLRDDEGNRLELQLADDLPRAVGSPTRLAQAVMNLLINADHAVESVGRGRIFIETGREGDGIALRVRDDGPGIPEAIQERIFDPFFTTKGPQAGTGLGLAVALDIIVDHGGTLEVQSSPGAGACFTARLPAEPR